MLTHMATRLASTHQSRLVYGACRPADAGDEHVAGSSPQRHRPEVVHDEGVSSSPRESTGVSARSGAPLQPGPLPTLCSACRTVWGGSGRRNSPNTRLAPQPPDSHLRRLPMSEDTLHH